MNQPRQILHILGKDIRGHALEIGIVLLLNVVLAVALTQPWTVNLDSTNTQYQWKELIGTAAQVLLVLAWCALIGRVVMDDGVAGKSPYWLTRPCSRPVLLASKLAFVLLFVHLPLFLSHFVIVTGSGLPLSFAQLLADQVVLAACVSLPIMALAALTTSFSRFVFGGVAVAAVAFFVIVAGSRNPLYAIAVVAQIPSNLFMGAVTVILASIAGVALVCQYRWRATSRVAISSIVALFLLGLGLLTLPTLFVVKVMAAVARPTTVASTIHFRESAEPRIIDRDPRYPSRPRLVLLPIDVTDTGDSAISTFEVDVRTAAGSTITLTGAPSGPDNPGAGFRRNSDGSSWLLLLMSPSDYDALKDSLVSVHFIAEIQTSEIRQAEPIPRDFSFAIVGGRAQCGIPGGRAPTTCRTSFGWSRWAYDTSSGEELLATYEMLSPVRLRFAINPILTDRTGNSAAGTRLRRLVSHTRQDVTFENIRLGDWGPE